MENKIAFIGLGNMGKPMALNLLKNGCKLFVYNRSKTKMDELAHLGAQSLNTPKEAFDHTHIAFSMVANDQALQDITEGPEGLLTKARPGCIHVSMSTISPKLAKTLAAKHTEKGVHYVAAPVFGRPDVAALQNLWICMAGHADAKQEIEPLLRFIGKKVYDFGDEPEKANVVKLSGNFLILSVVEMLSEAFAFAEKNGIPSQSLQAFLTDSILPSPVVQTYGRMVANKQFEPAGFKMQLGLKDIDLLLRAADGLRVPMPFAGLLHDRLMAGLANNRGEMDWSAIALTEFEEAGLMAKH